MTLDELKKHCKKNRYSDAQLSSFFDGYSKAEKDYQKGRADAIDEFAKLMKHSFECGFNEKVDRIAEQLKEK